MSPDVDTTLRDSPLAKQQMKSISVGWFEIYVNDMVRAKTFHQIEYQLCI